MVIQSSFDAAHMISGGVDHHQLIAVGAGNVDLARSRIGCNGVGMIADLDGSHHTVGFPIQNTNQGRKYSNLNRQQKPKALTSPL